MDIKVKQGEPLCSKARIMSFLRDVYTHLDFGKIFTIFYFRGKNIHSNIITGTFSIVVILFFLVYSGIWITKTFEREQFQIQYQQTYLKGLDITYGDFFGKLDIYLGINSTNPDICSSIQNRSYFDMWDDYTLILIDTTCSFDKQIGDSYLHKIVPNYASIKDNITDFQLIKGFSIDINISSDHPDAYQQIYSYRTQFNDSLFENINIFPKRRSADNWINYTDSYTTIQCDFQIIQFKETQDIFLQKQSSYDKSLFFYQDQCQFSEASNTAPVFQYRIHLQEQQNYRIITKTPQSLIGTISQIGGIIAIAKIFMLFFRLGNSYYFQNQVINHLTKLIEEKSEKQISKDLAKQLLSFEQYCKIVQYCDKIETQLHEIQQYTEMHSNEDDQLKIDEDKFPQSKED